jgi:integrase
MRQFYLSKNNSGYYNVRFLNPETGAKTISKSTHTKDKMEAAVIAAGWLMDGIPKARSNSRAFSAATNKVSINLLNIQNQLNQNQALELIKLLSDKFQLEVKIITPEDKAIPLIPYLLNFWDFNNSEYIKRYIAHGHHITKRHTDMMLGLVRNYWRPYFGDSIKIQDLDFPTLNDFFFYLHTEKQLSGATVNKAINCGSRAMRYLFENKKIDSNPMAGIERFNPQQVKRGIPTESEVRQLLNLEWSNHFYKLAFKLGIFCGLRAGEVSGLRVCDLDLKEDIIHVNHSWNDVDGLKPPKNSDVRNLPIDHETLLELYAQARKNPQFSRTSYVFFSSVKTEQPVWPSCYIDGLCDALEKIGISETERKERNIVFHSLRHFCATTLSQRADLKMVQAILGHKTEIMTKHYSDHETREKLKSMRNVMQVTWSDILNVSTF